MNLLGTFPFGWIRNYKNDNWQLLWHPSSNKIFIKSANKNNLVEVGDSSSWIEAKKVCDEIRDNSELLDSKLKNL